MKRFGRFFAVAVLLLFVTSRAVWAVGTLPAATVWEVRLTNGLDTNGGGYVAGSTGVDYSTQNTPQYSVTDAVTAGTTTITSATANFGTDVVGNIGYVTGGTGAIVANWYQVVTRVNATTITVDRSTGLTTGTGATLHIGGALLTLGALSGPMSPNNVAFVKAESGGTITAGVTFSGECNGGGGPNATHPCQKIIGYTTTRGDGGRATITLSTNTGINAIQLGTGAAGSGWNVYNIAVNCSSLGTSRGFLLRAGNGFALLHNCKISNSTNGGIGVNQGDFYLIHRCEVTGCAGGGGDSGAVSVNANYVVVAECNIYDNTNIGVYCAGGNGCVVTDNLILNNTGASSAGIYLANGAQMPFIYGNTIDGNGGHGIDNSGSALFAYAYIKNNMITNVPTGKYAIFAANAQGNGAEPWFDGNGFYNPSATGNRHFMDDTTTNKQNLASAYTNVFDVTETAGSPYVSGVSSGNGGNYALNNTAGRGALYQTAGQPATWPGNTGITTSYPSIGVQYKNTASGGAVFSRIRTMTWNERQRPVSEDYKNWKLTLCP